jgi:hypothetical protein
MQGSFTAFRMTASISLCGPMGERLLGLSHITHHSFLPLALFGDDLFAGDRGFFEGALLGRRFFCG